MSTEKTLWLATDERGEFVKCPDQGMPMSSVGWFSTGNYLNGGAYSDKSASTHRTYQPVFTGTQDDVQDVLDYPQGLFGNGPFYMVDPFAQSNILPRWLSVPRLMALDAPTFQRDSNGLYVRPTLTTTGANALRLPTKSAVFTFGGAETGYLFKFAHPPGFNLQFCWWGSRTGGAHIKLNGIDRDTQGTPVQINDGSQVNSMFTTVQLTAASAGTLTISGIMVQLRKTGKTFDFSRFISGRGTTQVDMNVTQVTGYSAARDRISVTLDVTEVGGWL